MLKKAHSLITDPRLPYIFPFVFIKRGLFDLKKTDAKPPKKLFVALTFDIESHPVSGAYDSVVLFLRKVRKSLKKKKSTFFTQGNMVEACTKELKILQRNNEVGLHGYAHEIWGDEEWWIGEKPIKTEEKKRLLEVSLDEFKKNKIRRPRSFRAPYMIINNETLEILKEFGFETDSSFPSYKGVYPLPRLLDKIIEIPVTANTLPKIRLWPLPHSRYEILTTQYLVNMTDGALIKFLQNVIAFQAQRGVLPHLVFLMHPWEFVKVEKEGFLYCSEKNYSLLERICEMLEKNYKVNYVTMGSLGRAIKKRG